jgi:hypothetical protein
MISRPSNSSANFRPLKRSSTFARRPSLPRTISRARSTVRYSTTSNGSKSVPSTNRHRPLPPRKVGAAHVADQHRQASADRFLRPPEDLATADRLLARRPAQRLDDLRPSGASAGTRNSSKAATRPIAAWSSRVSRNGPASCSSRSSAAPPAAARAASCRPSAGSANRCSTSRNSPATRARCWASCPTRPQPSQKMFESRLLTALQRTGPRAPGLCRSRKPQDRFAASAGGADARRRVRACRSEFVDFLLRDYATRVAARLHTLASSRSETILARACPRRPLARVWSGRFTTAPSSRTTAGFGAPRSLTTSVAAPGSVFPVVN